MQEDDCQSIGPDWWETTNGEPTASIFHSETASIFIQKLHQSFIQILSKHLAANQKVSFASQQKSSTTPLMNPTEIVERFAFVEVTLVQYARVAGTSRDLQLQLRRQNLRK